MSLSFSSHSPIWVESEEVPQNPDFFQSAEDFELLTSEGRFQNDQDTGIFSGHDTPPHSDVIASAPLNWNPSQGPAVEIYPTPNESAHLTVTRTFPAFPLVVMEWTIFLQFLNRSKTKHLEKSCQKKPLSCQVTWSVAILFQVKSALTSHRTTLFVCNIQLCKERLILFVPLFDNKLASATWDKKPCSWGHSDADTF